MNFLTEVKFTYKFLDDKVVGIKSGNKRLFDVILIRSGSLDTGHKIWMTSLPEMEDKLG